jgi:hypothetical protein
MAEFSLVPPRGAPSAPCHVAQCAASGTFTPILCVAQLGRQRVSRVPLPAKVCREHRGAFAERFLTPARRADMETSLRSQGRDSPDWERTHVEFLRA